MNLFEDGVPKEGLRIQDVLVRLSILSLVREKVRLLIKLCSDVIFLGLLYFS